MLKTKSPHIRVIVPVARFGRSFAEAYENLQTDQMEITFDAPDTGPSSIECDYDIAQSAPGTLSAVIRAEHSGADAVVIDCMADPALMAAREVVKIPVFGAAQSTMHIAAMLSHRFAILTVFPSCHQQFENQAALYGLSSKLAGLRSFDLPVLEIDKDPERTDQLLLDAALQAIKLDGAHALIFGCTGLFGYSQKLKNKLSDAGYDLPIIDPLPTTVQLAAAMVRAGLGHSKLSSPEPPRKDRCGFDDMPFRTHESDRP